MNRAEETEDTSVLKKHVSFFDRDGDGRITFMDTYRGFRELGFNIFMSLYAAFAINCTMAWATSPYWIPTTTIHVKNIRKCKHGSDSQNFARSGAFCADRLEHMWRRWDKDDTGRITLRQVFWMTEEWRDAWDIYGWMAAKLEWGFLSLLIARDGYMYKEDVFAMYDGSLFFRIAEQRKQKREQERKKTE